VSPSRKSFTAAVPGQPPSERLEGTLKATGVALKHGAAIIRTHDVAETINIVSR
jgi:dihydropteroate synthase